MKIFPSLFKKTNTGAIQVWNIEVEDATIITQFGQVDGAMQTTKDTVPTGKNLGKKNATTAGQQAELEAQAKWEKKIARNGYVESQERAERGETDAEGGIAPMLAQPHEDHKKKLLFPCLAQRKYNGVRCIADYEDGVCTLWSRKRERMDNLPHINKAVEALLQGREGRILLDGEAYCHGWTLQKIATFVRPKTPRPGHEQIQYMIYDYPSHEGTNDERQGALIALLKYSTTPLRYVDTERVESEEALWKLHDAWVGEGYEGAIGRNLSAPYQEGKRSYDLHKFKRFDEGEFKITGHKMGRGKYSDIPVLSCVTKDGAEFDCNPPGTLEEKRGIDVVAVIGKMLTVKHLGWTEEKKPSMPVGVVIRDYE